MTDSLNRPARGDRDDPVARLKQAETELRRMTKVFMDGADPIIILDLKRRLVDMNHEAERVFGWTRAELLGEETRHLLPVEFQKLSDSVWDRLDSGETVRNYEAAVRTKAGVEVPVLATSFLLTDEAGNSIAVAAILKDITELRQASAQLARKNDNLKQFTRALAHDLGAPLRGIAGLSGLLAQECSGQLTEAAEEYLQLIQGSAERMQQMIDGLLDYARLDHQEVESQEVDCSRVFHDACRNLTAAIAESGAEVTCGELPVVPGCETHLMQLFQNLIGNGIKFRGADQPRVRVTAEAIEDGWHFQVRDNGIGISAKNAEKIFHVFQRLHSESAFAGTGIGLAVCKTIVERHGGRIWVESEADAGSIFHFTLLRPAGAV